MPYVYLFISGNLSSDKTKFTLAKLTEYIISTGEHWVNKIGKTHTHDFQLNFDPEKIQGRTIRRNILSLLGRIALTKLVRLTLTNFN